MSRAPPVLGIRVLSLDFPVTDEDLAMLAEALPDLRALHLRLALIVLPLTNAQQSLFFAIHNTGSE